MSIGAKCRRLRQIIINSESAKKTIKITVFPLFLIFFVYIFFIILFNFNFQKFFGIFLMMVGTYFVSIFATIFTHYQLQSVYSLIDLIESYPTITGEIKSFLTVNLKAIQIWIITIGILFLSIGSILTSI